MPNRTGHPTAPAPSALQGEGNRDADRRFRKAQTAFAQDTDRVQREARAAAPRNADERHDMEVAERAARKPAKH